MELHQCGVLPPTNHCPPPPLLAPQVSNFMPTGTFLTFQALSTSVMDQCTQDVVQVVNGTNQTVTQTVPCCSHASQGIMGGLIAVLALACFVLTFTDTLIIKLNEKAKPSKRIVLVLWGPEGSYWPR